MSLQHAITLDQFEANPVLFGDLPGHEFHGNQWTAGQSGFMKELHAHTSENPLTGDRVMGRKVKATGAEHFANIEAKPLGDRIHISSIQAFDAGQRRGTGAMALKMLTDLADKHGVALELFPKKFGDKGLSTPQLKSWYKRHGFVDKTDRMVREPKATMTYNPDEPRDDHGMWTNSGLPVDSYSVQEAVSEYGQNTHAQINDYMRGTRNFQGVAREDGKVAAEVMAAAFKEPKLHSTTDKAMEVYRAIDNNGVYLRLSKLKTGDTFTDKAFVSTTKSRDLASNIVFNADRGAVLLHITLPKGTPYLRGRRDEKELILRNGSKFKITKMQVDKSHSRDEASIAYIWAKHK